MQDLSASSISITFARCPLPLFSRRMASARDCCGSEGALGLESFEFLSEASQSLVCTFFSLSLGIGWVKSVLNLKQKCVNKEFLILGGSEWFDGFGAGSSMPLEQYRSYNTNTHSWRKIPTGVTEFCAQNLNEDVMTRVFHLGSKKFLKLGSASASGSVRAMTFFLEP